MKQGIGHNRGPSLDAGYRYRLGLWRKARQGLMPKTLPVEIVRGRVRRARELGLDYKTYASIRAASGRDVIGFLFSDNALRLRRKRLQVAQDRFEKLSRVEGCKLGAALHAPLQVSDVVQANPLLSFAGRAPGISESWTEMREMLLAIVPGEDVPSDGLVIVGETALEREWCAALRAAYYITGDRYFSDGAQFGKGTARQTGH